jgi:protein-S-isoprenylcysteine O-methyltransferase Ste14
MEKAQGSDQEGVHIMSDTKPAQPSGPKLSLERSGIRRLVQVFASVLIIGALLFLSAGRPNWPEAWILSCLYLAYLLALMVWGLGRDPDLMNERGKRADNVKGWDKVLMAIYVPILFIMPVIAGLDAGRFGWSEMPLAWQVIGLVGLIPAMAMPWWAISVNTYLSTVVRIQDDRDHQVVTTGPYQYVRHPTYVGTILFGLCTPLLLGSWWALIPGGLIAILFVIRTALEDRTLRDELPGYAGYAERVRYRLLPGVW